MIYIERTININKNEAQIEEPIVLYKGDKNIELQFIINNNPFKYKSGMAATYGQLVIKRPNAAPIFSEPARLSSGKVLFTITGEMIDELVEIGDYDFQIRLLTSDSTTRGTLPPITAGITIKEPLCEEATTGVSTVNSRAVIVSDESTDVFDEEGNYIKSTWSNGDVITDSKLNKIEAALYEINDNILTDYATITYVDETIANINTSGGGDILVIEGTLDGTEFAKEEWQSDIGITIKLVYMNMCMMQYLDGNGNQQEIEILGYYQVAYSADGIVLMQDIMNGVTQLFMLIDGVLQIDDSETTRFATEEYVDGRLSNYASKSYVDGLVGDIESLLGGI